MNLFGIKGFFVLFSFVFVFVLRSILCFLLYIIKSQRKIEWEKTFLSELVIYRI